MRAGPIDLYGTIIGALLGALIIGMIQQRLILIGISPYWYQAARLSCLVSRRIPTHPIRNSLQ